MSSYQQTRQQKRNLKTKMINSFLDNDISNQEFDAYYQKCQVQKKLRFQSQENTVEDIDTNSSGYSSASTQSPTPSPSPSLSSYEDEEGNGSHAMNSYLDYKSGGWATGEEAISKNSKYQNKTGINFGATYSTVWYENDESDEHDYLTNEEIDRAIYEAEKWADF